MGMLDKVKNKEITDTETSNLKWLADLKIKENGMTKKVEVVLCKYLAYVMKGSIYKRRRIAQKKFSDTGNKNN